MLKVHSTENRLRLSYECRLHWEQLLIISAASSCGLSISSTEKIITFCYSLSLKLSDLVSVEFFQWCSDLPFQESTVTSQHDHFDMTISTWQFWHDNLLRCMDPKEYFSQWLLLSCLLSPLFFFKICNIGKKQTGLLIT